jgi:DNA replication protein DnaC
MGSGTVALVGPKTAKLILARKLWNGTATEKEREEYFIHYATTGENMLGKVFNEMSIDEYRRAITVNENLRYGDLDGDTCPICRNKGYVYGIYDGYEVAKECECMPKRRARERVQVSDYAKYITSKTFFNFNAKTESQKNAVRKARAYIKQDKYLILYFGGNSGTGKSHLSIATYYQLILLGYQGEFVRWQEEIEQLKASQYDDYTSYRRRMNKLKYTPLLLIDDFIHVSEGKPSKKDLDTAKEIIDERNIRGLKTIISSNFTLDTLFKNDKELGGRINEFGGGFSNFIVDMLGEDYRKKESPQLTLTDENIDF